MTYSGWSLVEGKFEGGNKKYLYLVRGRITSILPMVLMQPYNDKGFEYSNPFRIDRILAEIFDAGEFDENLVSAIGHFLSANCDLRILEGNELLRTNITSPTWYLAEVAKDFRMWNKWRKEAGKLGGERKMEMKRVDKKQYNALEELLLYWYDEVFNALEQKGDIEKKKIMAESSRGLLLEKIARRLVTMEGHISEGTEQFEKRTASLITMLYDATFAPKEEETRLEEVADRLDAAKRKLSNRLRSLLMRANVVEKEDYADWLRVVGVYRSGDGLDFDIMADTEDFWKVVN